MSSPLIGFSGTPRTTAECQQYIDALNKYGSNGVRLAFSGLRQYIPGDRVWNPAYVQYFLDHWDGYIVLDVEHIYVYQGGGPDAISQTFYNHLDEAMIEELARILPYNGNPRVGIELVNEYDITNPGQPNDFYSVAGRMASYLRNNGIINEINCNLPSQHASIVKTDPALESQGYHFYFNSWNMTDAMAWINSTLAKGIRIINTEQGASSGEAGSFTPSNVAALSSYLSQCFNLGVGNFVWLNYGVTTNLSRYEELGLVMPRTVTPITHPLTVNSDILIQVTVDGVVYSEGLSLSVMVEEGDHTVSVPRLVTV